MPAVRTARDQHLSIAGCDLYNQLCSFRVRTLCLLIVLSTEISNLLCSLNVIAVLCCSFLVVENSLVILSIVNPLAFQAWADG